MDASTMVEVSVAEPARLGILRRLSSGRCCVCDLQCEIPIATNLLGRHLRILRDVGLVTAVERGRWVDDEPAAGAGDRLCAALPGSRRDG